MKNVMDIEGDAEWRLLLLQEGLVPEGELPLLGSMSYKSVLFLVVNPPKTAKVL